MFRCLCQWSHDTNKQRLLRRLDKENTIKILDSLIKDKPLKPGFTEVVKYFPEKQNINEEKHYLNLKIKFLKIFIIILVGK